MRKSVLTGTQSAVNISMPISKVDVEKRLVSGFASLDNVDQQGDRIIPDANIDAFQSFRGNIREMHSDHNAVGKLVNFEETMYYDEKTEKFYSGIYVTVYVSKGAPNTWEKVIDGTLTGFSIGGAVIDFVMGIDDDGNTVRTITKYMLTELSLVDNPANQLANIVSIHKSASGESVMKGMVADVVPQTIFFCPTDNIALVAKGEEHDCAECGGHMENIGWCESSGENIMNEMQKAITSRIAAVNDLKGGANMTVENTEETDVEVAEVEAAAAPAEEVTETDAVTEVAVEEEVTEDAATEADEEDLSAVLAEFQARLLQSVEDGQSKHAEQVESLRKELGGIETKFSDKFDALEKKLTSLEGTQAELDKNFKGIQDSVSEVQKGLQTVDSSTAIKKSADNDQSAEDDDSEIHKSVWGGVFLNTRS